MLCSIIASIFPYERIVLVAISCDPNWTTSNKKKEDGGGGGGGVEDMEFPGVN